jgi:hypothetical protein
MRLRVFDFDLVVMMLRFRRETFRWTFRVDFRTGEGDGEIWDDALALMAEGLASAPIALGAEERQPTNNATTDAIEI